VGSEGRILNREPPGFGKTRVIIKTDQYHVPIKHGIPALAVLDSRGGLLYAMDQGQFADARNMSYESIRAFFVKWEPIR
jgi:hypothetical protein